jgi:hypothetical protein
MQPATTPHCSFNRTHPSRGKHKHATSTRNARTARLDPAGRELVFTVQPTFSSLSCRSCEEEKKLKDPFLQKKNVRYPKNSAYHLSSGQRHFRRAAFLQQLKGLAWLSLRQQTYVLILT